jgi:hypothetical protein
MENSPTLLQIAGELIMSFLIFLMFKIILKLQESLISIGLKLQTPRNSCGMFNFEMIKEEEQGNKNIKARFVLSKPLVRDDLFEVSEPQKDSEKNRSERKMVELRGDDIGPIMSSDEIDVMKIEK